MKFTPVPLADLDRTRSAAKIEMDKISKITGVKIKMRTFYLGPRPKKRTRPISTRKGDAYAAKLAFYKVSPTTGWPMLVGYY